MECACSCPFAQRGGIVKPTDDALAAMIEKKKAKNEEPVESCPFCQRGGIVKPTDDALGEMIEKRKAKTENN